MFDCLFVELFNCCAKRFQEDVCGTLPFLCPSLGGRKAFNKSVACRPKCYTLIYDAWGASLSSPSETAAKWRSSHLGLFFLQSQIFDKTKLSPFSGEMCEDDMKQLAFMVLALFYRLQSYKKKNLHVKEKMRFFIKGYKYQ